VQEFMEGDPNSQIEFYGKDGGLVYRLQGILIHRGGAYGGHYYAYIHSFEDGNWYLYDDTTVRLVDEPDEIVKNSFGHFMGATSAYMLIYKKVELDAAGLAVQRNFDLSIPEELKAIATEEIKQAKAEFEASMTSRIYGQMRGSTHPGGSVMSHMVEVFESPGKSVEIETSLEWTIKVLKEKVLQEYGLADEVQLSDLRLRNYRNDMD
jgi:hypothetical protein